ncbi:MAG TPA: class I SAM-dependent methyltransferase [Pyrinomonadaceae bacterium]|nr:class I SAM-dependent methyltransferase [Pyrinomonadaceae bacterium]
MLRQQIRRFVPAGLRPHLGALRRRVVAHPLRVRAQRRRLLRDPSLGARQRELLDRVSDRIHFRDGMYAGDGESYFRAGLSAVDCLDDVLRRACPPQIRRFLDLPCGYGRELRFFVLRFPGAAFTACDIQPGAVDFCAREFGARPVYSRPDLSEVSFEEDFDLVWCGSLVTHLDAGATLELLRLFARHLAPGGLAVFTTNGDHVARRMREGGATYDLPAEYAAAVTGSYARTGQGYHDYPRGQGYFDFHPEGRGYGVSVTAPDWIRAQARRAGPLEEVYFKERGWADHQDVFAFVRRD